MKPYILIAAALLFSCGGAHTEDPHANHDHDHAAEAAHTEDSHANHDHSTESASEEIVLSEAQLTTYNIESEQVTPAPFSSAIRTGGRILSSSGDQSIVAASSAGIVTFAASSMSLGRAVSKGQVLFTISSQNIQGGESYSRVKADYIAAKKQYDRSVAMAADQIISQKELEQAELNYKTAKIAYQAENPSATGAGVNVVAPMSGYLTSIDVTNGSYAALGAPLATIAQNKRLTLRADVPSKYFSQLATITEANFKPSHSDKLYSTKELNGHKTASSRSLADGSSYLSIDFELDNRGELLAGSLLDVYLIGAPRDGVISVPVSALLEQEGHHYVMVRLDHECFEKREVTLGASNGKRTEVLSGLDPSQSVVTRGAFQVKMATASTAIPDGHNH